MSTRVMTWEGAKNAAYSLARRIVAERDPHQKQVRIWGIPRGGGYVAALLDGHTAIRMDGEYVPCFYFTAVSRPQDAHFAVDDIIDTGTTASRIRNAYGLETHALVNRQDDPGQWGSDWIIFPWEGEDGPADDGRLTVTRMIQLIGDDPTRPGLANTPDRVVRSWATLFGGYQENVDDHLVLFPDTPTDSLIIVRDIPFHSTCEHHMMPFTGTATIGYLPNPEGVIGLSKFARIVNVYARRLQIQERLTKDVADAIGRVSRYVVVEIDSAHQCVEARGIMAHGQKLVTTAQAGSLVDNPFGDRWLDKFYQQLRR